MKKILSIFFAATAIVGGMTSCTDYLEEDNKTGETADLMYQTKSGIDGLVYSAYSYARGWWGKEPSLGLSEMGTDLFYGGYDNKQNTLIKYDFTSDVMSGVNDNCCFDEYWEMFYAGIDVCNNVIKYAPLCNAILDNEKHAYKGDGYFLRALYYSQVVALWGPVPYNKEPMASLNTTPVRLPEAEVYKNILADLDEAMKEYEAGGVMKRNQITGEGRAYYYSALALKARVALYAASWLGNDAVEGYPNLYSIAQQAANTVIEKSEADLYDRFSDTWNMDNEDAYKNKETLFSVHYTSNLASGYDNCVPYRFSNEGKGEYNSLITRKGYKNNGGSASLLMFVSLWNNGCGDLGGNGQKDSQVFWRVAAGKTTIKSKSTGGDVEVGKYYSPYGRGFTRYLPSLYLWKILANRAETDQRYKGTLLLSYNVHPDLVKNVSANYPLMGTDPFTSYDDAYKADGNYFEGGVPAIVYSPLDGDSPQGQALQAEAKGKYRLQFASGGDIPVYTSDKESEALPTEGGKAKSDVYGDTRYNDAKIEGKRSFPGLKKFLDDQYDATYPTNDISYRDIMVLRIAEMYLIKAEAQLHTENAAAAKATLNILREKRALAGKKVENQFTGTVDIETLLEERAVELCGEYQRWYDLKRTHTLIDHVKKYNKQASGNIALKHYYRPIPITQLQSVTNRIDKAVTQDANGVLQYKETDASGFWQNPGY